MHDALSFTRSVHFLFIVIFLEFSDPESFPGTFFVASQELCELNPGTNNTLTGIEEEWKH